MRMCFFFLGNGGFSKILGNDIYVGVVVRGNKFDV